MKKVLHILLSLVFLTSCNSDSDSSNNDELPDIITEPQRGFFPSEFVIQDASGSRDYEISYTNDNQISEIIIAEYVSNTGEENNRVIDFTYNEDGLLTEVFEFFSDGQTTQTTTFQYDDNSLVSEVTITTNTPTEYTQQVSYDSAKNSYQFDIFAFLGFASLEVTLDESNNIVQYELPDLSNTVVFSYNSNENGLFRDFIPQPSLIIWSFLTAKSPLADLYYFSRDQIDSIVDNSQELIYGPEGYDYDENLNTYDVMKDGSVLFYCDLYEYEEFIIN